MQLQLNEKYKLVPLLEVDNDDLSPIFNQGRGMYIVNFPDQDWYDHHGFKRQTNYSIEKKQRFFDLMNKEAQILSLTQDSKINKKTRSYKKGRVHHFGSHFTGRIAQLFMGSKLLWFLIKERKSFDYLLCYNFHPIEIAICILIKFLFSKTIVVDFEDNYLQRSKNPVYPLFFSSVKNSVDMVICINRNMTEYFSKKNKLLTFNGFINIDFMKEIDLELKEGTIFLFAGALDEIRGVDLIPLLIKNLRKELDNFKIYITGSGYLKEEVLSWTYKEVEYLGFLSNEDYNRVLSESDAYLILQKPDHPFSKGSFPSKIEYYSQFKKPIYKIENIS